jgi:hypothetical protein
MKSKITLYDNKYLLSDEEDSLYFYRIIKGKDGTKVKDEYRLAFNDIASINFENMGGKFSNVKYFIYAAIVLVVLYSFPFTGILLLLPVLLFYFYILYKNSFTLRVLSKDGDLMKFIFETQAEAAYFGKKIRKKVGFVKNTFYYRKYKVSKFFKYT